MPCPFSFGLDADVLVDYSGQALIIAIIFTAVAAPAAFLPSRPPTAPSNVASVKTLNVKDSLVSLSRNPVFYLQFFSFMFLYVHLWEPSHHQIIADFVSTASSASAFDATATVVNQLIEPYGYSQINAGYSIMFMIFIGIILALVISPILDRKKGHLIAQKIIVPVIAIGYTILPFIPQTRSVAALYAIYAIIGGASLSMEPVALEFQASWTHPVSPEFSSVICWAGAKVMGAIFILAVGNDLWITNPEDGQPQGSLFYGLIFQFVMVWLCVPFALMTGFWIFKRPAASVVKGND